MFQQPSADSMSRDADPSLQCQNLKRPSAHTDLLSNVFGKARRHIVKETRLQLTVVQWKWFHYIRKCIVLNWLFYVKPCTPEYHFHVLWYPLLI